jgi:hypothetical protein
MATRYTDTVAVCLAGGEPIAYRLFPVIECSNCSGAYCKLGDTHYFDRLRQVLVLGVVPRAQNGHGNSRLVVEGAPTPGI